MGSLWITEMDGCSSRKVHPARVPEGKSPASPVAVVPSRERISVFPKGGVGSGQTIEDGEGVVHHANLRVRLPEVQEVLRAC